MVSPRAKKMLSRAAVGIGSVALAGSVAANAALYNELMFDRFTEASDNRRYAELDAQHQDLIKELDRKASELHRRRVAFEMLDSTLKQTAQRLQQEANDHSNNASLMLLKAKKRQLSREELIRLGIICGGLRQLTVLTPSTSGVNKQASRVLADLSQVIKKQGGLKRFSNQPRGR